MPNGGVPMHMILYPRSGPFVLHVEGRTIRVHTRPAWIEKKAGSEPLFELNEDEAFVLNRFLTYWLRDEQRVIYSRTGVDVEFDF